MNKLAEFKANSILLFISQKLTTMFTSGHDVFIEHQRGSPKIQWLNEIYHGDDSSSSLPKCKEE